MDRTLIQKFAAGGPTLRRAVAGLTKEDVTKPMEPGAWSIMQLVVHMADSDDIAIDRMRRIIAEDNPKLMGFDENKYLARLHPHAQSLEDAVTIFEVNRRQFVRILEQLSDTDFARKGTHSERGPVSVTDLLKTYGDHLDHHLKFLHGKRERLGKPLKT